MTSESFAVNAFFPEYIFDRITDIRVDTPEVIERQAQARIRREKLTLDGKITILAADHPARGVTALGNDATKMGDRQDYLARILRVMIASDFDGFMSTPDMIEELLILDYLVQEGGGPSFLDHKVLIGCMQRGGLAGVAGEIDDRFTAYTPQSLSEFRLDGGKMLWRFVPDDERTLRTLAYCAQAITDLNREDLIAFVEPLRMDYENGKWVSKNTADELIRMVGIASGLGDSSRNLWLKLPYCEDYRRVAMATTLPIILLGGPSKEDPTVTYREFAAGMAARPNVRGGLVGRNVSYPGGDDPAAVAQVIHEIVHNGAAPEDAGRIAAAYRGKDLDFFTRYIPQG